ncbi:MAG TPA: methyltransferase domain-containing protein, partial [Puia sp.]|nr:methyltransferase domain-containing protein [Puia sp.]
VSGLLNKLSLINRDQLDFSRMLRRRKEDFLYSNCLRLPLKDGSADFCYSSHMLGWCLSHNQLDAFFKELYRVLKPGGGARLSFFNFDRLLQDYQQHRSTIDLFRQMPLGIREFGFRDKLRFLFSWNMQNGIPLNVETISGYLEKYHFRDIRSLPAGATSLSPEWVEGVDLFERAGESVYIECRKGAAI